MAYRSEIRPLTKKIGKRKKKRKVLRSFLPFFFIAIVLILGKMYGDTQSAFKEAQFVPTVQTEELSLKEGEPFTTLIIGTEMRNGNQNLVAVDVTSINPKLEKTTIVNITPEYDLENTGALSESYILGGNELVIDEVSTLLEVPVNKIVEINFDEIGELVEAVGGISLQNDRVFRAEGYEFSQGTIYLKNKEETKAYLTMLGDKDAKRTLSRQHDVAVTLFEKLKNPKTFLFRYNKIMKAFPKVIKTNIDFKDFRSVLLNYRKALSIDKINVHGTKDNSTGLTEVSQESLDKVREQFAETLQE